MAVNFECIKQNNRCDKFLGKYFINKNVGDSGVYQGAKGGIYYINYTNKSGKTYITKARFKKLKKYK